MPAGEGERRAEVREAFVFFFCLLAGVLVLLTMLLLLFVSLLRFLLLMAPLLVFLWLLLRWCNVCNLKTTYYHHCYFIHFYRIYFGRPLSFHSFIYAFSFLSASTQSAQPWGPWTDGAAREACRHRAKCPDPDHERILLHQVQVVVPRPEEAYTYSLTKCEPFTRADL